MKKNFPIVQFFFLFLLQLSFTSAFSQTYLLNATQSQTTCAGIFYDSGGSGGSYGANQNFTITFCSGTGEDIWLQFTQFQLENNFDFMYIYNGPSTASPLMGTFTSTNSPGTVVGTSDCITVRFSSDGSVNSAGWTANIGCGSNPPPSPCSPSAPSTIPGGCLDAQAFCTELTYSFPNSTGIANAGSLACLGSTPNPAWFYIEIDNPGNMDIFIEQDNASGTGIDVDFALLGPYTSLAQGCATPSVGCIEDCSFSGSATETANVIGGQTGEVYLLLLTNFSNQTGTISFSQTGGVGSSDCSIVNPVCEITTITANAAPCDGTNNYTVTGQLTIDDAPTTGTLLVTSSCGGSQEFLPPFASTINYSISGVTAPGSTCTINAFFTNFSECNANTTVNIPVVTSPVFSPIVPLCQNDVAPVLPTTSTNGITGTWSPSVINTSIAGTVTHTFTPNTGQCATAATLDVTINPSLVPTFDPLANVCQNATVIIPTTSTNGISGTWSPAVNTSIAGTTTYTFTPTITTCTATTTLNLTVIDLVTPTFDPITPLCVGSPAPILPTTSTNGVQGFWSDVVSTATAGTFTFTFTPNDPTCTNGTQISVTVNPLPTVNAGTGQTVCLGDDVTLNGSGAFTYVWDNAITNGVTFTPALGTITYTLTGTDANGCQNTDQVDVTAVDLPVVDAGADQTICIGESVTLDATGATTYTWDNGATQGGNISPTVTTTYTVVGTAGTCQDDDQITITVNPLPLIDVGTDVTVCEGETLTLSGLGAGTITWDNGVTDGVAFLPNFGLGGVTFTATLTDANGCQNSDDLIVTVNPLPLINAGIDQTVCIGDQVTLSASNGVSYVWDNGITNGAAFAPALGTITYTVIGTDANGCENTDQVDVTVVDLPVVDAGADLAICIGESVTLTATGATTYVWDNGATQGGSVAPTVTTTYTVLGTAGSCQDDDQITVTVNALPTVTASGTTPICLGETTVLEGEGAASYVWDNGVVDGVAFEPQTTATYTVLGTDANGCENSASIQIVVNSLPEINAGIDQTVCIGDQLVLSASNGVNYFWDNGVTNGVAFTQNPGTMTYTVIGIDGNGCENTDQVSVTVVDLPVVNAGADVSICIGESVNLTATGATTYQWDNGVTQGGSVSPTVTTTYSVVGTAGSCQDDDQITITVNPLPQITIPFPNPICFGQTVTLNGQGGVSYVWNNNVVNGVPFSPQISGEYTVVGTDVNGCQNSAMTTVNVNPLPNINAGLDISVCPGEEFVLNGSGGTTYSWNNGAINGTPLSVNVTTVFTVTGTDINGCQNTDQITVTMLPLPAVNAGPDITICDGESATLNGSGAPNLAWDNGVQQNVPFTPLTTTIYTLIGVDNNGCVNQDQVTVTVSPIPVVSFIPNITNGCGPLDVTFTVQSAPGVSCTWDFGDGTTGLGCGAVTHTYNGEGCFDVSMTTTSLDGCVGSVSYTDLICLVANPIAEFTATPLNLSMNNSVSQMVNLSEGAFSYLWNFGDSAALSTEVNPTHTYPFETAGSYTTMLIAYNEIGCSDTAFQLIQVAEDIIFYVPNTFTPDGDQFNQTFKPIFTAGFDPYDYNLKIFNRWGELIFESNNAEVGWNGSYSNVADAVPNGVYVWKIEFKQSMNDKRRMEVGNVNLFK